MSQLVIAAITLFALWQLMRQERLSDNPIMDRLLRRGTVWLALSVAIMALSRGNIGLAGALAFYAGAESGWLGPLDPILPPRLRQGRALELFETGLFKGARRSDGRPVDAQIRVGRFAGSVLSALSLDQLLIVRAECAGDLASNSVLEAYLDGRFAGWREHVDQDTAAGTRHRTGGARSGPMTKQEAYEILGVQPGATADDVRKAHRALIQKIHPDKGGTAYLAARVNEARDLLLH